MNLKTTIFILLNFSCSILSKPTKQSTGTKPSTCQACHPIDEEKINIHLVPHSHDDVGWLKTVDQYYYGSKKHIQYAGVQYIISSSIEALKGHPDRRFIQVESAFFWKWWQNQGEAFRQEVIDLVNNGQLEIINGGWSMNDEAATNYQSIIDQFTWGFRFLNDSLGECGRPKIGWQIDPFGHSKEHASILTQLGFQGLVIGRLDFRDKTRRKKEKQLDFLWQASDNLNNSQIFTTMFPDFYVSERGYCFDVTCDDEPIDDDVRSPGYNLKSKVERFAQIMDEYKKYYQTSHMLIPMGGDFNYQAAEINFANIDKLIKGFQGHKTFNVFYSTPSCYIKAVNDEVNKKSLKLQQKTDDFFPYASEKHNYWTGYFTSRPTLKRFERLGNNILQATKQLTTFSKINGKDEESSINDLREVMGIMQHHDAITGTEKEDVAKDYVRLLTRAIKEAEKPIGAIIGNLLTINKDQEIGLKLSSCLLANVSICEETKKDRFLVAIYNPLSREVDHYVHLPVDHTRFNVSGPDGEEKYDVFDSSFNFSHVEEKTKPSTKELVFAAKAIPPLGLKLYFVEKIDDGDKEEHYHSFEDFEEEVPFGTESNGFTIDKSTRKLDTVTLGGITLNVTQEFLYYMGSSGSRFRASGAYIFHPEENKPEPVTTENIVVQFAKGLHLDQVRQIYDSKVSQIIRVYKGSENYIEFDWLVGDLKTDYRAGKEVITRFTIDKFKNKGVFFTDSNGREQVRRELNKRNDYQYENEEYVSGNYYPVTSKIVIKDEQQNLEVAVLNDRAQGGSSLSDGVIELMVNRRLVRDDGLGVGESLKEEEYGRGLYARGQHYLVFGFSDSNVANVSNDTVQKRKCTYFNSKKFFLCDSEKSTAAYERDLAQQKLVAPLVLVGDANKNDLYSLKKSKKSLDFQFEGLTRQLPENVKILTLEPWRDDTYLLRLEHTLEKNEDSTLSRPVVVDLENLFTWFTINEIGETTLGANQWLDEYEEEEKFIWNNNMPKPWTKIDKDNPLKIELHPMQIRTFLIRVEKNK